MARPLSAEGYYIRWFCNGKELEWPLYQTEKQSLESEQTTLEFSPGRDLIGKNWGADLASCMTDHTPQWSNDGLIQAGPRRGPESGSHFGEEKDWTFSSIGQSLASNGAFWVECKILTSKERFIRYQGRLSGCLI